MLGPPALPDEPCVAKLQCSCRLLARPHAGHPSPYALPPNALLPCSKSDPLAVLLVGDPHGSAWSEAGRTDVVANSLSETLGGQAGRCNRAPPLGWFCRCRARACIACCEAAVAWPPPFTTAPRPHPHPPTRCADPDFRQPLVVTYEFERLQPCRLVVYDVDTRGGDPARLRLEQQDFLGEAPPARPAARRRSMLT